MDLNLLPQIENEISHFTTIFCRHGWNQEDDGFISRKVDFDVNPLSYDADQIRELIIAFMPKLLYYRKRGEHPYVYKIWIECRIKINADSAEVIVKNLGNFLQGELTRMMLHPFNDEDCKMKWLTNPKFKPSAREWTVSFFLNKEYPKGYWNNHTLGD